MKKIVFIILLGLLVISCSGEEQGLTFFDCKLGPRTKETATPEPIVCPTPVSPPGMCEVIDFNEDGELDIQDKIEFKQIFIGCTEDGEE